MRIKDISGVPVRVAGMVIMLVAVAGLSSAQAMTGGANQSAMTAQNQVNVAGSLSAVTGNTLFVTTPDNLVKTINIGPKSLILGRNTVTLDSIRPGEALGVAATQAADGVLTATVINIFTPELWQQVRKGQFPMPNGQIMTNAPVDKVGGEVKGKVLYLKYEMLTAAIKVPADAEIHRMVAKNLAALKVGGKLAVRGIAKPDGSVDAGSVSFDLPTP